MWPLLALTMLILQMEFAPTLMGLCSFQAAIDESNSNYDMPYILNLPAGTFALTSAVLMQQIF